MAKKAAAKHAKKKAGTPAGRMGKAVEKSAQHPLRVVLLDSHAILHRAYHAIPDFTKSNGEPTGAIYGLILTLLKIVETLKPDYIVATRDLPGKTLRHVEYAGYKATRAKIDEELIVQLKQAPLVFEAFGIPVYCKEGYEADDMLGTIVAQTSAHKGVETIIATGDSDTLQLVKPHVKVFMLRTGIADTVIYDEEGVRLKYGFGPEHVIDYKGIVGDTSDNIPGVPGVGATSAQKLISAYGDLAQIYKEIHASGVEAVAQKTGVRLQYIKKVAEHEAQAIFSKKLATIHHDVPIEFELPKQEYRLEDYASTIGPFLDAFEFRSLKERLKAKLADITDVEKTMVTAGKEVDPAALEETSVALWLLRSEISTPDLPDILTFANTEDFDRAREKIFTMLRETGRLSEVWESIEKPLIPIIHRMHKDGIAVDVKYLAALSKEYTAELAKIAARIYGHAGHEFNINSPKQLGDVLYDELKIGTGKQKKTATGARTTREDELSKMADLHPIIADVLAYRELQKLLSTYIDKIPSLVEKDGRLHAQFLQAGAATGRMASQNPNLQNIPVRTEHGKRIRESFVAADGFMLAAIDYSQIELRIAAGLSGDEKLIGIFQRGEDVHAATASQVFGVAPEAVDREMRRRAKVINFGILYGMGVNALRANLDEGAPADASVSREEAAHFLDQYFKNFSGLAAYIEESKASAAKNGYTETVFGRRRYFPGFKSSLPNLRAQAERMAVNAPIQGTQADIIKRAMIEADELVEKKNWRSRVRLLLQVHDELVYEVDAKTAEEIAHTLRRTMEGAISPELLSGVPIVAEVSIGANWGAVKKVPRL
jgi:DNA polymerase-1